MPCLAGIWSAPVTDEEKFTGVTGGGAIFAAVLSRLLSICTLAEDPHLECGMSDAFHICCCFFLYVREANQCRFRRDESSELLPKQTVDEISADAVVAGV